VNDASKRNLDTVRACWSAHIRRAVRNLTRTDASLRLVGKAGQFLKWRARRQMALPLAAFLSADPAFAACSREGTSFQTTNLAALQYRHRAPANCVDTRQCLSGRTRCSHGTVRSSPGQFSIKLRSVTCRCWSFWLSLLGYWLSARALAPVSRIIQGAERVGVRNLSRRLEVPRARDELRRLHRTLERNASIASKPP